MRIPAVLGTMSIPDPLDAVAAQEALDYFLAAGFDEIDTAILYQGGATEATLGTFTQDVCPSLQCSDTCCGYTLASLWLVMMMCSAAADGLIALCVLRGTKQIEVNEIPLWLNHRQSRHGALQGRGEGEPLVQGRQQPRLLHAHLRPETGAGQGAAPEIYRGSGVRDDGIDACPLLA